MAIETGRNLGRRDVSGPATRDLESMIRQSQIITEPNPGGPYNMRLDMAMRSPWALNALQRWFGRVNTNLRLIEGYTPERIAFLAPNANERTREDLEKVAHFTHLAPDKPNVVLQVSMQPEDEVVIYPAGMIEEAAEPKKRVLLAAWQIKGGEIIETAAESLRACGFKVNHLAAFSITEQAREEAAEIGVRSHYFFSNPEDIDKVRGI